MDIWSIVTVASLAATFVFVGIVAFNIRRIQRNIEQPMSRNSDERE